MSNTITSLTAASTIDAAADYLAIDTSSLATTQKINRNTFLNLTSQPVGLTDSQTLTNKILTAPTISSPVFSGTVTGTYTIGGTPTFPSSVVTLTGSQTLTNKVLTSPTINSPTITNATLSADAITGFSSSSTGTIYGISVTSGTIGSAALAANSVLTAAISDNNVTASKLATNAITLGYAQSTSNFATASTSSVQVTSLTATVTIPAGNRKIKITGYTATITNSGSSVGSLSIWDGVVNSGTQLNQANAGGVTGMNNGVVVIAVVTPSAGSKTYNLGFAVNGGTGTVGGGATFPSFILVEAI